MSSKRSKRYNDEFKKQIVGLVSNGKKISEIVTEYDIARSTVNKWVKNFKSSGSFKAKDNRTDQEKELIKLRKENQRLKMENEIISIFKKSKNNYGTRKIKQELVKKATRYPEEELDE